LAAALSFDFFFTQPYNSLKINNAADIETTILLLVVGLIIGEIAVRADRIRFAVAGNRRDLSRLHRVARLAADGENVDDMISAVSAELTATLGLHDCIYERPPFHGDYPTLKPTGALTGHGLRYFTHDGYELPREGVELPLVVHDQTVGRFVLLPTAGLGVALLPSPATHFSLFCCIRGSASGWATSRGSTTRRRRRRRPRRRVCCRLAHGQHGCAACSLQRNRLHVRSAGHRRVCSLFPVRERIARAMGQGGQGRP
jgi:hypothetical protein